MKSRVIAIILLLSLATYAFAQTPWRMSEAGRAWWNERTETERSYFLIGYSLAGWVWARGLHTADDKNYGGMPDDYYRIYMMLSPAASYNHQDIAPAITRYYQENPHSRLPIWQVIHTLFITNFAPTTRGDF